MRRSHSSKRRDNVEAYDTLPIVPLRDGRRLSAHDDAVRHRATLVHARAGARAGEGQADLPRGPEGCRQGRSASERHLHDGLRGQHRAEPQAAGRQREGAGRRRRPRTGGGVEGRQGLLPRGSQGAGAARRHRGGRRGHDEPRRVAVRAVRQALQYVAVRRHDCRRARRRPQQAGRHDCRAPGGGCRGKAEPPRDHRAGRAARPHRQHPGDRGRQAAGGPPHPVAREEADGEGAEGVLPQREDEGDPEGAGSQGGPRQRGGRSAEED